MTRRSWLLAALVMVACALALPLRAQTILVSSLREEVVMIPATASEPELEATIYHPPGDGPFPIVVINHGRATGDAKLQERYRPAMEAREFVRRGYVVVVPMREGFANSGGRTIGGGCKSAAANGLQQARSVRRVLDWLGLQAWADVSRNVVMGQSHGGFATLAYGVDPHPGTRLLVNFAGGLRLEGCAQWEGTLTRAIGAYGENSSLPSLWFYGDNDSFFTPAVWREAHQRYVQAGGRAELVAFGRFGSDSHTMFGSRFGLPIWLPRVMAAMDTAGLPIAVLHVLALPGDLVPPPSSGFAKVDQLDRLPVLGDEAREGYAAWLHIDGPKAFAIQPASGSWGSAWGGARPYARALWACERETHGSCKLYAVDDTVVWKPE